MPASWKLRYRLLTEDAQHTCRHHMASLQHDANVYSVTFTRDLGQDYAVLDVVFNEGVDQPATPELHALDRRYPSGNFAFFARPEDYAVVGATEGIQRETLLMSGRRSGMTMQRHFYARFFNDPHPSIEQALDFHRTYPISAISMGTSESSLSAEFGVATWRQLVPAWAQPGVHAKETATAVIVQIEGIVPCPDVSSGFILAKICNDPGMKVAILVDFFARNYVEAEKPVIGPTWHEILLGDDGI
jgi:hypothetical protein